MSIIEGIIAYLLVGLPVTRGAIRYFNACDPSLGGPNNDEEVLFAYWLWPILVVMISWEELSKLWTAVKQAQLIRRFVAALVTWLKS